MQKYKYNIYMYVYMYTYICIHICTANPSWDDIVKSSFKAQSSKLESLFSPKRGKRDV